MRSNLNVRWLRHMNSMDLQAQTRERTLIEADPAAHRDTTLMSDRGLRYRFYQVTDHTKVVRYCYATLPNAAGYWLTWTETLINGNGKREYIRGQKLRREALESALCAYENHQYSKKEST